MPLLPDFSQRSARSELMDDLAIEGDVLEETLELLERINAASRGPQISLAGMESLVPEATTSLSVLDVGTGAGDIPRHINRWAEERGIDATVTGIDLSDTTVEYARRQSAGHDGLRFEVRDLFDMPDTEQFDVVHASLVLHHFAGDDAARALDKMASLCRLGVIVNDLQRHPVSWLGLRLGLPILTTNKMIRNDGPLSVLRGFTRRELRHLARQAGLGRACVAWQLPFRWLLVCPD
jgi:2-polyprenyl-3-methyl-5-hydroxy-6-metoxy-1,4-benzoquinol methylase